MSSEAFNNNDNRKKRVATILVFSLFLVVMAVAVVVGFTVDNGQGHGGKEGSTSHSVSASSKAVMSICRPTDYKEVCISSIESQAKNSTNPKKLIQAALEATIQNLTEVDNQLKALLEKEKDPRTAKALAICKELSEDGIDSLKKSDEELGMLGFQKFDEYLADLKTWISSVVSDQQTCLYGFDSADPEVMKQVQKNLFYPMEMSSNALAIVTEISSMLSILKATRGFQRRLLEDKNNGGGGSREWSLDEINKRILAETKKNKPPPAPDFVVAQDGTGMFKTINEALKAIPEKREKFKPYVIYIKAGLYKEDIQIGLGRTDIVMLGDGPDKTRITGNKSFRAGFPTYQTATFAVMGDRFVAKNIAFENTAGASELQAVALRVHSDRAVFFNCAIDGYHSTLLAHSKRQFFRDCTISGAHDIVFGDSAAVFQNCSFIVRKPLEGVPVVFMSQLRSDKRQVSGFVVQNSSFKASPEYDGTDQNAYLGAPATNYSRIVIMESYIGGFVSPRGWIQVRGDTTNTCWLAELKNSGEGASIDKRVTWGGVKTKIFTQQQALEFTSSRFIFGDLWIKPAQIPYSPGLILDPSRVAQPHPLPNVSPAQLPLPPADPAAAGEEKGLEGDLQQERKLQGY